MVMSTTFEIGRMPAARRRAASHSGEGAIVTSSNTRAVKRGHSSGHSTASDALVAGVPLVTRMGETFASRVAASLLRAIDLPELVTATEAEFEELAVALARDTERYRALRQRLKENRLRAPLFDIRAFTSHLEAAYSAMYERYQAGLAPEHIEVARLENRP